MPPPGLLAIELLTTVQLVSTQIKGGTAIALGVIAGEQAVVQGAITGATALIEGGAVRDDEAVVQGAVGRAGAGVGAGAKLLAKLRQLFKVLPKAPPPCWLPVLLTMRQL